MTDGTKTQDVAEALRNVENWLEKGLGIPASEVEGWDLVKKSALSDRPLDMQRLMKAAFKVAVDYDEYGLSNALEYLDKPLEAALVAEYDGLSAADHG